MFSSLSPIIFLASLVLALISAGLGLRLRHPRLGYAVGLAFPILAWGYFMAQMPSVEYCRQNGIACEWTGIGIVFITLLTLLILIVYSLLSLWMNRLSKRVLSEQDIKPRTGLVKLSITATSLLILLICIPAGALLAKGIFQFAGSGVFTQWRSLGSPPEPQLIDRLPGEKATGFTQVGIGVVTVRTSADRLFATNLDWCLKQRMPNQNCWYYGQEPAQDGKTGTQDCMTGFWVAAEPNGTVATTRAAYCNPSELRETRYAILKDGTVWVWSHDLNRDPLFLTLTTLIPGGIAGMAAGVFLSVGIWKNRRRSGAQPAS